ncbi:hypothetical protein MGN70_008714 [Eutypa lata]|nr:hypothetical protein MGN70_008714 [Eutypa lata]
MVAFSSLALLWAPLAIAATPPPLIVRGSLPDSFGLYAYGTGIGGAPVFYSDGLAYLGDPREIGGTVSDFVLFKASDESLVGNQNATSGTPSWSNVTFYVPTTSASSHQTGFITNSTASSNVSTSGFTFYGGVCMHTDDGALTTLWYAAPTDTDGVWTLNWNSTDDTTDGQVIVSLKTKAPSRPAVPPKP